MLVWPNKRRYTNVNIVAAYPDCDESGRHEANYSGNKECRIRNFYNWRTNIDEGIWQGWSNSQKQHIIEQVCSPFGYLHRTHCQFSYIIEDRRTNLAEPK